MVFPLRGAVILGAVGAIDKKKVLERHVIQRRVLIKVRRQQPAKQELKLYYHRI